LSASVEIALRDKLFKVAEQIEATNYDMCDNLLTLFYFINFFFKELE
jgi:hypothetical protein